MKNHNTPEYRAEKRIVAFVRSEVKKKVLDEAKKNKLSISKQVGRILVDHFDGS